MIITETLQWGVLTGNNRANEIQTYVGPLEIDTDNNVLVGGSVSGMVQIAKSEEMLRSILLGLPTAEKALKDPAVKKEADLDIDYFNFGMHTFMPVTYRLNLRNIDLSGKYLRGVRISYSDLGGVKFNGSFMQRAVLYQNIYSDSTEFHISSGADYLVFGGRINKTTAPDLSRFVFSYGVVGKEWEKYLPENSAIKYSFAVQNDPSNVILVRSILDIYDASKASQEMEEVHTGKLFG